MSPPATADPVASLLGWLAAHPPAESAGPRPLAPLPDTLTPADAAAMFAALYASERGKRLAAERRLAELEPVTGPSEVPGAGLFADDPEFAELVRAARSEARDAAGGDDE